jgi:hypothetical protein
MGLPEKAEADDRRRVATIFLGNSSFGLPKT